MHFPKLALFALLTPVLSLTTPVQKRADILPVRPYTEFQISDGVAGNALAEVAANFPVRNSPVLAFIPTLLFLSTSSPCMLTRT